ncbi:Ribonuclease III [Roseibacterium elongatum DSM 19469]|uniref:Ribonuclease 3 n=1 Tax=Roseicyclus elongatus DSM 19469 TaxID=1294273 RepID=W8SMY8_9RHOB|nr:ribonuclease III [Roseibacterium elongatum]AHM03885.1 Ribonuclease III [Roseibacterium elongatum DSM 19469]
MALAREVIAFCDRLGHRFSDEDLILRALTHSSLSSASRPDNQRLEFLGDRVLGLVMAQAVLQRDQTAKEGTLAPRFNALVRKEACAEVAREINLGAVLRLGKSEMTTGGRRKTALLGDAMEAVIAAVYLDAGFDVAQNLVLRLWGERLERVAEDARDPKTALQEWAQARGQTPPRYTEVARTGPDHAPVFTVEARMETGESARAEARVKRQAEQAAARALLERLTSG